jgi:DNA repair exonuclease SbcCD nuclease subunit
MKIVHSSNIHLGKSFVDQGVTGDKLRAGIKACFSKIIDLAISEKADLVVLAGDTFDNVDISENLLKFFISEVERLQKIPLVILPGVRDAYQKASFWEQWEVLMPAPNLHPLTNTDKPYVELPQISTTVHGYPVLEDSPSLSHHVKIKRHGNSKYHIGVVYGNMTYGASKGSKGHSFGSDELSATKMDYVALGGNNEFHDLTPLGVKAAYPGSPETLSASHSNSGHAAVVDLTGSNVVIEPRNVGTFIWKNIEISMETVANIDDLKAQINELSGPNVLLKATLKGLTLFEAGLNIEELKAQLDGNFLQLDFVDNTSVLPENVSEVKVREKTILGQYLKVMVEKLNAAKGPEKSELEESLKAGYTLLTGKEI